MMDGLYLCASPLGNRQLMATRQPGNANGPESKSSVELGNFSFTFNCSSKSCASSSCIGAEVGASPLLLGPGRLRPCADSAVQAA